MSGSLIAALLWLVATNVKAMFPSRVHHWRFAYAMIAIGIPILGWVTYEHGPLVGFLVMAGAASVLRWPLVYFYRFVRRQFAR